MTPTLPSSVGKNAIRNQATKGAKATTHLSLFVASTLRFVGTRRFLSLEFVAIVALCATRRDFISL